MAKKKTKSMDDRYSRVAEIISAASMGDYTQSIEITEQDSFTELEMGMNFMIQNLTEERDRREKAIHELEEKLETIRKQQAAISELSTPIIQIWDSVLTLPVIGVVDSRRSEEMMESLLEEVVETQSQCVIIDVTGVNVVDTKTADHFIKMVKAVKLLGAECIITGISPEIAQTLTNIGIDLTNVKTLRNLRDGLKESLRIMGLGVGKLKTVKRT